MDGIGVCFGLFSLFWSFSNISSTLLSFIEKLLNVNVKEYGNSMSEIISGLSYISNSKSIFAIEFSINKM